LFSDLYRVSSFQVYCTSTSCLTSDLDFFMFAVMKIFVTDISASTGRNDFIFDIFQKQTEIGLKSFQLNLDRFLDHKRKQDVARYVMLRIPPLVHLCQICILRIFHVCCNENFCNRYLSFYWKKWFYIWYMTTIRSQPYRHYYLLGLLKYSILVKSVLK
jgi:hypothetical protein